MLPAPIYPPNIQIPFTNSNNQYTNDTPSLTSWTGFITPDVCQSLIRLTEMFISNSESVTQPVFATFSPSSTVSKETFRPVFYSSTNSSNCLVQRCGHAVYSGIDFPVEPFCLVIFPHTSASLAKTFELTSSVIHTALLYLTNSMIACCAIFIIVPRGFYCMSVRADQFSSLRKPNGNQNLVTQITRLVENATSTTVDRVAMVKNILDNTSICTHFHPITKLKVHGCAFYPKQKSAGKRKSTRDSSQLAKTLTQLLTHDNSCNYDEDAQSVSSICSSSSQTSLYSFDHDTMFQPSIDSTQAPLPNHPSFGFGPNVVSSNPISNPIPPIIPSYPIKPPQPTRQEQVLAFLINQLYANYSEQERRRMWEDYLVIMRILDSNPSDDPFILLYQQSLRTQFGNI